MSISLDFENAVLLHEQGDLAGAERLYKNVIHHDPIHFDAIHNSALLQFKQATTKRGLI